MCATCKGNGSDAACVYDLASMQSTPSSDSMSKQERMNGIESRHRHRPREENAATFEDMLLGNELGTKNCLRFKIDMQAPNKALRDPVAYRCNLTPHWRTKSEFKVGLYSPLGLVIVAFLVLTLQEVSMAFQLQCSPYWTPCTPSQGCAAQFA